MNVQAHIDYWLNMAQDDIEAADILFENKKYWQALFYAHLSLEKTLKAHVTRATKDIPPKIHNLLRLAEIASLTIAPNQRDFLIRFDTYNIEGRYPGEQKPKTSKVEAQRLLNNVKEMREWLMNQF